MSREQLMGDSFLVFGGEVQDTSESSLGLPARRLAGEYGVCEEAE